MRTLIAGFLALVALSTLPASSRAATFVVNYAEDGVPGLCEPTIGGCTLREAILAAVATPGRDTIRFDPNVFPLGRPEWARVESALPVIADPAGTVIDGAGAGVVIVFAPPMGGGSPVDGLVFTSAPGVALTKPTVANVAVRFFSGSGIVFCGGTLPECDEDLSSVLVQNVVAMQNGVNGIVVDGRVDTKIQILDSVVSYNGLNGIDGNGGQSLNGLRVERCTAYANELSGFSFNAANDVVGTMITDSVAVENGGDGFVVNAGQRTVKTKLTNLVARGNAFPAMAVTAGREVTDLAITNALVTGNFSSGIDISAGDLVTATLKDVAANNNGTGIFLSSGGTVAGSSITRATAASNQTTGIHVTSATGIQIRRVVVAENGHDGLYLEASQSSVKQVRASGNGGNGILLVAPGSGNTITKSSFSANDGDAGLKVEEGNTKNVIEKNISLANDGSDLFDANPSCTNQYKKNVFRSGDVACQ